MTISKYIQYLEDIKSKHGDLEVETTNFAWRDRAAAQIPVIAFKKNLTGKQKKPDFWCNITDARELKGSKVVRI